MDKGIQTAIIDSKLAEQITAALAWSDGSLCCATGNYQIHPAAYSANHVLRSPKSLGEIPGKCRYAAHLSTHTAPVGGNYHHLSYIRKRVLCQNAQGLG